MIENAFSLMTTKNCNRFENCLLCCESLKTYRMRFIEFVFVCSLSIMCCFFVYLCSHLAQKLLNVHFNSINV